MTFDLIRRRLANQNISVTEITDPARLVSRMGAIQAQDYPGSLWSIGLRLKDSTEEQIENAIAQGKIIRTWPMRGTLHFVHADDASWILQLLTPGIIAGNLPRLKRMGLDEEVFKKSRKVLVKALQHEKILTREDIYEILASSKIQVKNQLGIHILWKLAQEGLICFGPKAGKKFTFVLFDEWIPGGKNLKKDEAFAEIAERYFLTRGPATLEDFAWWTGLNRTSALRCLEIIDNRLNKISIGTVTYYYPINELPVKNIKNDKICLLPGFDEYLVSYKDRTMLLEPEMLRAHFHGLVTPKVLIHGRIGGVWKREMNRHSVSVRINWFHAQPESVRKKTSAAIQSYSKFIGKKIEIP